MDSPYNDLGIVISVQDGIIKSRGLLNVAVGELLFLCKMVLLRVEDC